MILPFKGTVANKGLFEICRKLISRSQNSLVQMRPLQVLSMLQGLLAAFYLGRGCLVRSVNGGAGVCHLGNRALSVVVAQHGQWTLPS